MADKKELAATNTKRIVELRSLADLIKTAFREIFQDTIFFGGTGPASPEDQRAPTPFLSSCKPFLASPLLPPPVSPRHRHHSHSGCSDLYSCSSHHQLHMLQPPPPVPASTSSNLTVLPSSTSTISSTITHPAQLSPYQSLGHPYTPGGNYSTMTESPSSSSLHTKPGPSFRMPIKCESEAFGVMPAAPHFTSHSDQRVATPTMKHSSSLHLMGVPQRSSSVPLHSPAGGYGNPSVSSPAYTDSKGVSAFAGTGLLPPTSRQSYPFYGAASSSSSSSSSPFDTNTPVSGWACEHSFKMDRWISQITISDKISLEVTSDIRPSTRSYFFRYWAVLH